MDHGHVQHSWRYEDKGDKQQLRDVILPFQFRVVQAITLRRKPCLQYQDSVWDMKGCCLLDVDGTSSLLPNSTVALLCRWPTNYCIAVIRSVMGRICVFPQVKIYLEGRLVRAHFASRWPVGCLSNTLKNYVWQCPSNGDTMVNKRHP